MQISRVTFCALILTAGIAFDSYAQTWYRFNQDARSCESDVIKLSHGKPPSGYWGKGIIEFRHKAWDTNFGYTLDCFGCGSAKYDKTGPSTYEFVGATADYVDVHVKYTDCVTVDKVERLYRGAPVLEINYAKLSVLWFEDFWDIKGADPVYAMYGVDREINRSEYGSFACKPQNFGDCFIKSLGSTVEACTYKNHLIFGTHSKSSGRGIGEVYPVSMGVHDWKIWWSDRSIANYEVFPAAKTNQKRWIFVYDGGKAGLVALGKSILDNGGKPLPTGVVAKGTVLSRSLIRVSVLGSRITVDAPDLPDQKATVSDLKGRVITTARVPAAGRLILDMNGKSIGAHVISFSSGGSCSFSRMVTLR